MGFSYSKTLFISLHFAKKLHENRSGESRTKASQTLWGQNQNLQKLHFLEAELP